MSEIKLQGKPMTEGSPWKHILKFALPVLLGSLLQQLYNTVDAIIVGNFSSEEALSAVGTTGVVVLFFLAIALGCSAGNGVVIAQRYGAKDEEGVRRNASAGILFLFILGIGSAALGMGLSGVIFTNILSVQEDILGMTLQYFMIYSAGLVFQYLYNSLSSILRAVGDSAATLYFLLVSSVLNTLLDLLFVAVFGWGVVGAAVATVIAQLGSVIAAYVYMRKKYTIFRFRLSEYRWDGTAVKKTIQIGLPISLQMLVVSVGLCFIQKAVNEFGKVMTASFTVGSRIEQYIMLPFNAFQTTLATYVGQNIGAGKLDRVKKGTRQAILMSIGSTIVISAVIWLFAQNLAGLFGLSEEALVYCIPHIRTVAIVNVIMSAYVPLFGVYQGMRHSGIPAIVATCALSVRVVIVYALRYSPFLGYTIIWWNGLFGFGIGCTITWIYYLSGRWYRGWERIKEQ